MRTRRISIRDYHLDLSKYAGQTVKLRLHQRDVTGKAPGAAYWQKAEIRAT